MLDRAGGLVLFILAVGFGIALAQPADAGISALVFRLTASNAAGVGQLEIRFSDGVWNPQTGDFSWSSSTPLAILNPTNGAFIATLRNANLLIVDQQRIDLTFSVQAGATTTRFDAQSAQLLFSTIPAADADARATCSLGINDTNFNGGVIQGTGTPGTGSFIGQYNGLPPSSSAFTTLVYRVSVSAGGTASAFQTDPAFGFRAVNAAVNDSSTYLSFTVTPADIATANTSYEMTANGSSPPVAPTPGCDPTDVALLPAGKSDLLLKGSPDLYQVADVELVDLLGATITDVELGDFSGDHRADMAVAWYASYGDGVPENKRVLTIFFGKGAGFDRHVDFDLYVPDEQNVALSIMRNGTADITSGDFDGDGDRDLAVTPFFGDEIWFIENLGLGNFAPHLRFMFEFNGPANFCTPPEALAADFDGDGRDELVYIVDPIQHLGGRMIHFWKTDGAIADIARVDWEGLDGGFFTQWTRALAVADFDGDNRPDLCFTGSIDPPEETEPILTFWHNLNPATGRFVVHNEFPAAISGDVVAVPNPNAPGRADVMLTRLDGGAVESWTNSGTGPLNFDCAGVLTGYSGLAPQRGMAAAVADVDLDGRPDVITKQRLGGRYDVRQIEVSLSEAGGAWSQPARMLVSTLGFENDPDNEILRPNNLAVADLSGNRLPEVVAGFGIAPPASPFGSPGRGRLIVGLWRNSCIGDVTRDGYTDTSDLDALLGALPYCQGHPLFNPDADLNKDGCITSADVSIWTGDEGCNASIELLADLDCDGIITFLDIEPFIEILFTPEEYEISHPGCTLQNADVNRDSEIDFFDIEGFSRLLVGG